VSQTCPGPRSAHAVAASPSGGGKLFLFGTLIHSLFGRVRPHLILGGEFSSLYQNTFHHYRDFWCFDIMTHSWDRIETKVRPSARSGHRFDFLAFVFLSVFFLNKPYLEWHCGSTISCSSVDFTIQASLVSLSESAHSSEVSIT
jgi:galactose oxidase-like protein